MFMFTKMNIVHKVWNQTMASLASERASHFLSAIVGKAAD